MSALTRFRKRQSALAHIDVFYALEMSLKDRIKHARTEAGLSQSALARACKVDPSAINKLESGETKTLSSALLLKLAATLSVDSNWIATGKHSQSVPKIVPVAEQDPVLADLAALDPDDAALWRAQIRVAANKARKEANPGESPPKAHFPPKRRHSG